MWYIPKSGWGLWVEGVQEEPLIQNEIMSGAKPQTTEYIKHKESPSAVLGPSPSIIGDAAPEGEVNPMWDYNCN